MSTMQAMQVHFSEVYPDYARNFRDVARDYADCVPDPKFNRDAYERGEAKCGFFEDIWLNGIVTPITVVLLSESEADDISRRTGTRYKYRVAKGHRRMRAATEVNRLYPETINLINALVYSGLSPKEEWELLADHSANRREAELSKSGVYKAVINLHGAGFSQVEIARLLGFEGRGYAQRHINVHQMAYLTPIELHWIGFGLPKDDPARPEPCVRLTNKNIDDLMPAYNMDRQAGKNPMADDSSFRKVWESILGSGKSPKDLAPKAKSREDLVSRKSFIVGRPALEEVLAYASGDGGNMQTAAAMFDKVASKAELADGLAARVAELEAQVAYLTASNRDLVSDIETIITEKDAEIEALKAELSAVKSTKPTAKK